MILQDTPWVGAAIEPMQGDASNRRYSRLRLGDQTAILMEDPAGTEVLAKFEAETKRFAAAGVTVPDILAHVRGGLVLSDLGNETVYDAMARIAPDRLYSKAIDVLLTLRDGDTTGLAQFTPDYAKSLIEPLFETHDFDPALGGVMAEAVDKHCTGPMVLSHRDFHIENLMWRGDTPLGVVDYQDAIAAPPGYDIASLLGDARHTVPEEVRNCAIRQYANATGADEETLVREVAVCGVQRSLRLIWIFHSLIARGKPSYKAFQPTLQRSLERDLNHPGLADLRRAIGPLGELPHAVMFFAAGLGTRMRPLTDNLPKPLIKADGKALLDHAMEPAVSLGLSPMVANTHYLPEMVEDHLLARDVATSPEPDVVLETGGGLRHALPLLGDGPVFTMNTDAVWRGPNPFDTLDQHWDPEKMDGLVLLIPEERATGFKFKTGFGLDPEGRALWQPDYAYAGAQILKTGRLREIDAEVFSLRDVWDLMRADGRLYGCVYPGHWCDVGTPEAIGRAEALLEASRVQT